jgi:hypothetical protein
VLVKEFVRNRYELVVPPIITGLVAAEQQDSASPGIEGIQDAVGPTCMLDDQFLHMGMSRCLDISQMGPAECRTVPLEQPHFGINIDLFGFGKAVPTLLERVSELDLLFHRGNMASIRNGAVNLMPGRQVEPRPESSCRVERKRDACFNTGCHCADAPKRSPGSTENPVFMQIAESPLRFCGGFSPCRETGMVAVRE